MTLATTLLLMLALAASVSAWLWGPAWARHWRRQRVRRQAFPSQWREVLRLRMPYFQRLPADLQLQLKKHTQVLLAEVPFIGCAGLTVSTEMRVLIAAQAALLLLNRRDASFRNLRQVLVYPTAFVIERAVATGHGTLQEARQVLAGESWQQGQVILSWQDVLANAAAPQGGHNVVIHEFAHQLDQESGSANGAPYLFGRPARLAWARTLSAEYQALQQRLANGEPGLINAYAATNPAEFFAVVSELFFGQPQALATEHPALFREFSACYGVNPLSW